MDLTEFGAVTTAITKFKPTFIIHSAAQRFPDKVSSDPEAARCLNVDATFHLADTAGNYLSLLAFICVKLFNVFLSIIIYISDKYDIPMLYISTDYVFDGQNPPFKVGDKTKPLNEYGKLKLEGEEIVLAANKGMMITCLFVEKLVP